MSGWLSSDLPTTGAVQVFATLVIGVLFTRLFRYGLRLVGLGR